MAKRKLNRIERLRSIHKTLGFAKALRYARRVKLHHDTTLFVLGVLA